jgi:glucosamine--fructose-6-phosphate aminotransferase (isomerizing)
MMPVMTQTSRTSIDPVPCPGSVHVIEGPYLKDLLDQPVALAATCRALESQDLGDMAACWAAGVFDRILLTGMGSSHHLLQAASSGLAATGAPVISIETSELIHAHCGLLTARTLLVVVSQSGESAEILRLLERIPAGCRVVGITNTPESLLAKVARPALITAAGPETTVACKTYLAATATLLWFSEVLRGGRPDVAAARLAPAAGLAAQYLESWKSHVDEIASALAETHHLYLTGRGPSLAAAAQGALTMKEAAGFPVEAMSAPAFRHGPVEVLCHGTTVIALEGTGPLAELNRQFQQDLCSLGGSVHLLGRSAALQALRIPSMPDHLLPLFEILPLQLASLALAAKAGREAGRFRMATKVTRVE